MNTSLFRKKILVEGKNIYELYDCSKDELEVIGAKLEKQVAEANGTTSFFVKDNKASKELRMQLELVKEIYAEKENAAERKEEIRKLEEKNKLAMQVNAEKEIEAMKHMKSEDLLKLFEDNNKKIAELKDLD